jgi:hypothetical protein
VGEVWTTEAGDRQVQGVVASVTPDIITLVSFTGNRFRASPDRVLGMWSFSQPPPYSEVSCYRPGCTSPGILVYNEQVYTCPNHAPIGVVSRLIWPSREVIPSIPPSAVCSIPCPFCSNVDTVENLQAAHTLISSWQCLRCGEQWVSAYIEGEPLQSDIQLLLDTVSARNLTVESIIVSSAAARSLTWNVNREGVEGGAPILLFGRPLRTVDSLHRDRGEVMLVHLSRNSVARRWTTGIANVEPETPPPPEVENPVPEREMFTVNLAVQVDYPDNSMVGGDITIRSGTGTPESGGTVTIQEIDPPTPGSQWVNKRSGAIVTVTKVIPGEGVHYKDEGSSFIMTLTDFLEIHTRREYTVPIVMAVVPVVGEEWENTLDNLVYSVTEVFVNRMTVIVERLSDSNKISVKLQDFSSTYWKKVQRRTAYEHLLDDDED